jgi:hydrogenase maturation protease
MSRQILVAGIGNIFLGDDAFGVEVVNELLRRPVPDAVCVSDFGIRCYDLAYAMMDGYKTTILVDAAPRGEAPGTLYLMEPAVEEIAAHQNVDAHSMNPMSVLQLVRALGGRPGKLYLVGCEPEVLENEQMTLSPSVRAAVPHAVTMIETLIGRLLNAIPATSAPSGA